MLLPLPLLGFVQGAVAPLTGEPDAGWARSIFWLCGCLMLLGMVSFVGPHRGGVVIFFRDRDVSVSEIVDVSDNSVGDVPPEEEQVGLEEVFRFLSERGQLEWQLAYQQAVIARLRA